MTLVVHIAGIANVSHLEVERALRLYVAQRAGKLVRLFEPEDDPYAVVVTESPYSHTSVLFPPTFTKFQEACAYLSKALLQPVFALSIPDTPFWMYSLYVDGHAVDRFNPRPAFWGDVPPSERHSWRGSAALVCEHWPKVEEADIEPYLIAWDRVLAVGRQPKAHPEDMYAAGDAWQLFDFTDKLGLLCAVDNSESPLGHRYHLHFVGAYPDYRPRKPDGDAGRPWWKFW